MDVNSEMAASANFGGPSKRFRAPFRKNLSSKGVATATDVCKEMMIKDRPSLQKLAQNVQVPKCKVSTPNP